MVKFTFDLSISIYLCVYSAQVLPLVSNFLISFYIIEKGGGTKLEMVFGSTSFFATIEYTLIL